MARVGIDLSSSVGKWTDELATAVAPRSVKRIMSAAGRAGKESALEQARRDLGPDRRFSGLRSKSKGAALGAGYDVRGVTGVDINLRPKGLWVLANSGRKNETDIFPRSRRSGHGLGDDGDRFVGSRRRRRTTVGRALPTPYGFFAKVTSGPTKGHGTIRKAERDMRTDVPKAAHRQFTIELTRALRR